MRVVEGLATVVDVDDFVARIGDVGDEHDCVVQAFDARYVVDRAHLETAVRQAARAWERDEAVARDPAVEVLLYAAGRRQISEALTMGVGEGETPVVAVVVSGFPDDPLATDEPEAAAAEDLAAMLDSAETLGEAADEDRIYEFFEVGEAERAATDATLSDLVRERAVLLTVNK
ncbi:KEOPS complex subunit Cgi121 [Haloarchaeobius amylolyticus]|uniref:KEOPS complex subunit Cgi121 n=1 Tax=Haloarchaeobius amylolyticus TaxID=1198296 RepID=UPI0022710297|nr:KEOPS complex subunit Cgi121 [Haloarchaeobius amylolyticus]